MKSIPPFKRSAVFFSLLLAWSLIACGPSQPRPADPASGDAPSPTQPTENDFEQLDNLIRVTQPTPNSEVSSPLAIEGSARGYWYFEADFPVRLEDYRGNVLARGVASAQGKWMTEDFVPFTAELRFDAPDDERGYLVFERANPSGLPENDRAFRLPVLFAP